jgi:hypothetical protein
MAGRRHYHFLDLYYQLPHQAHWKIFRVHSNSLEGGRELLPCPSLALVSSGLWSGCTQSECHGSDYREIHSCTELFFGNTIIDLLALLYNKSR